MSILVTTFLAAAKICVPASPRPPLITPLKKIYIGLVTLFPKTGSRYLVPYGIFPLFPCSSKPLGKKCNNTCVFVCLESYLIIPVLGNSLVWGRWPAEETIFSIERETNSTSYHQFRRRRSLAADRMGQGL